MTMAPHGDGDVMAGMTRMMEMVGPMGAGGMMGGRGRMGDDGMASPGEMLPGQTTSATNLGR